MTVDKAQKEREQHAKLIALIQTVVHHDDVLREKYDIGDKFYFVRRDIASLLSEFTSRYQPAENDTHHQQKISELATVPTQPVYVYLYNAQGMVLRSWAALMTPKALYEHSVNRPIYLNQGEAEELLRGKSNPAQHAILTVQVFSDDILLPTQPDILRVKVREGALRVEHIISLRHNGSDYKVNAQGELIEKK